MRRVTTAEFDELVSRDLVAHLATIDQRGYPHVTPIWLVWSGGVMQTASDTDGPHPDCIHANPPLSRGEG